MNEKEILNNVKEILSNSKSQIVATRESLEEANNFAINLIKASAEDNVEINTRVSLLVYHNTLVAILQRNIEELEGMD